ncbi:MAG: hypothetical protein IPG71_04680 [bacterium]|nr:hypothetical protein [bacterium]
MSTQHRTLSGRYFLLALSLLAAQNAVADTTWVAAGNVHGTWTVENSPYVVFSGHAVVPTDCTLTLLAGTTVLFTGPFEFVVNGRLRGDGLEGDSVRFTCDTLVTPGGWRGLRFVVANDSSYLNYGVIEHGRATGVNNERYGRRIVYGLPREPGAC